LLDGRHPDRDPAVLVDEQGSRSPCPALCALHQCRAPSPCRRATGYVPRTDRCEVRVQRRGRVNRLQGRGTCRGSGRRDSRPTPMPRIALPPRVNSAPLPPAWGAWSRTHECRDDTRDSFR
jgi:hypothetical protein